MKDIAAVDAVQALETCTMEDERDFQPGCISLPAVACLLTMSTVKDSLLEIKCEIMIQV